MKAINQIRTDLCVELRPGSDKGSDARGLSFDTYRENGVPVTAVTVQNEAGKEATGKELGTYFTLDLGQIWLDEEDTVKQKKEAFARTLSKAARLLCPDFSSLFVACLGNVAVTADALGPTVQHHLHISHHLKGTPIASLFGPHPLSALSPGVIGQTGIETLSLIKAAVAETAPSLILAVDALAARSPERLCTTIQIGTAGIAPGSGIGNHRQALNQAALGVPVLAIGVPTLVDSSTLLLDAFDAVGIDPEAPKAQALLDPDRHFFVTRKETDLAVSILSPLIAEGINRLAQDLVL